MPQKNSPQETMTKPTMNRHKFNIFPEAKPDDYARLIDDIQTNGYDQDQPVIVYQGAILDGWNRNKACVELMITPTIRVFDGSDIEAIQLVMRTNKRRNLNSGQWATIAVEAEDIMGAIAEQVEKERREKIGSARSAQTEQIIVQSQSTPSATATKAAEIFQTNRTYINQATKIKKASPEVFAKVKAGTMTMQDANKAVRAIPTSPWIQDEIDRSNDIIKGKTCIANAERDKNLIEWATKRSLVVYIDRGTIFGNPFVMPGDGDRDEVCDAYADHYLTHKPTISAKLESLRGKLLVCHCYPERCHGESLIAEIK
jgi:hypothetical protein